MLLGLKIGTLITTTKTSRDDQKLMFFLQVCSDPRVLKLSPRRCEVKGGETRELDRLHHEIKRAFSLSASGISKLNTDDSKVLFEGHFLAPASHLMVTFRTKLVAAPFLLLLASTGFALSQRYS